MTASKKVPLTIKPSKLLGKAKREAKPAPLEGATWYTAREVDNGLFYRIPKGALAKARYLTADALLDGDCQVSFTLLLQEGAKGRTFRLRFGLLNQCQARIRFPIDATDQNRWGLQREAAWLKPLCGGDRVDPAKVDRMTLLVSCKAEGKARWCLTPFTITAKEPPLLDKPILPRGPILDELGQSAIRKWKGKCAGPKELVASLKKRKSAARSSKSFPGFSRWGGSKAIRFEKTGFFRTHHDGQRWWLVDPDGYAFWSIGADCVRSQIEAYVKGLDSALTWVPPKKGAFRDCHRNQRGRGSGFVDYFRANLIRAFGRNWHDAWGRIAIAEMRKLGFNTVACWSEEAVARKQRFPYTRWLGFTLPKTPKVFRDFPDVYHPSFKKDVAAFARQLKDTANDPAMIGYFLTNEPKWAFAKERPAAGILFTTTSCACRDEMSAFLRMRYRSNAALSRAWRIKTTFAKVRRGKWTTPLTKKAEEDLADFSSILVDRLFGTISKACREAAPNHLNLGMRYAHVPPPWALKGMKHFDVFSMNIYQDLVPVDRFDRVVELLEMPTMVGEWHFGALDAGQPSSGLRLTANQKERAKAYRRYIEHAASQPTCVGAHWFTMYDQSAIGRFDGEAFNIGFFDICHKPYEEMGKAARTAHQRIYRIAQGRLKPAMLKVRGGTKNAH